MMVQDRSRRFLGRVAAVFAAGALLVGGSAGIGSTMGGPNVPAQLLNLVTGDSNDGHGQSGSFVRCGPNPDNCHGPHWDNRNSAAP